MFKGKARGSSLVGHMLSMWVQTSAPKPKKKQLCCVPEAEA